VLGKIDFSPHKTLLFPYFCAICFFIRKHPTKKQRTLRKNTFLSLCLSGK
jgi:hypothetical protein